MQTQTSLFEVGIAREHTIDAHFLHPCREASKIPATYRFPVAKGVVAKIRVIVSSRT